MQFTDLVVFKDMEALIMPQLRALLYPPAAVFNLKEAPRGQLNGGGGLTVSFLLEGVLKSGGLCGFFQTPFH